MSIGIFSLLNTSFSVDILEVLRLRSTGGKEVLHCDITCSFMLQNKCKKTISVIQINCRDFTAPYDMFIMNKSFYLWPTQLMTENQRENSSLRLNYGNLYCTNMQK